MTEDPKVLGASGPATPDGGAVPSTEPVASGAAAADEMWRKTRVKVKQLERENEALRAKEAEREAASKSDVEKAIERAKQEARAEYDATIKKMQLGVAVQSALMKAEIEPDFARMVDVDDEDGVAEAVAAFAKAHPNLVRQGAVRQVAGGGGAQSPVKPGPLSREAVQGMSLKEFSERQSEIMGSLGTLAKER